MPAIVNARQTCASSQNDAFCSSRACRDPACAANSRDPTLTKDIAMASSSLVAPIRRSLTLTALLGAIVIAGPLAPARAETPAQPSAPHGRAARHAETVEQRIASLHAALKITPDEEPAWQAVAQVIRDNAARCRSSRRTRPPRCGRA